MSFPLIQVEEKKIILLSGFRHEPGTRVVVKEKRELEAAAKRHGDAGIRFGALDASRLIDGRPIMARLLMLGATFAVICPLLGGHAQSAPISPIGAVAFAGNSFAQQIGWRGCGFWQQKCAVRWGPGTWRSGRCMWRHGCWGPPPPPPPLPPK